jgi:imidazoleglycerol-phosphate dehydratase
LRLGEILSAILCRRIIWAVKHHGTDGRSGTDDGGNASAHLAQLGWHGQAQGDTQVDDHHTVEDTGIVLGQALDQALGDRKGIQRFGSALVPMDEALVLCAIDLSGRGNAFVQLPTEGKVGTFDVELAAEFFRAFAANGRLTLHLQVLSGENKHHLLEAAFKACAVALRQAIALVDRLAEEVPSTKGVL